MHTSNDFQVTFTLQPTVKTISRPHTPAPAAAEDRPARRGRFPRVTQVLALAVHFQEMVDSGQVHGCADLARLGCVSRERISQIMILNWLAPDIQESILTLPVVPNGRIHISEAMLRPLARLPLWEDQRARWREIVAPWAASKA